MLASSERVAAEREPETEVSMTSAGRGLMSKALKGAATMILVGAAAMMILSESGSLPWPWSAHEIAPTAGTLILAVGVVLLASYLSTGKRSRTGQGGSVRYDRNASLDL